MQGGGQWTATLGHRDSIKGLKLEAGSFTRKLQCLMHSLALPVDTLSRMPSIAPMDSTWFPPFGWPDSKQTLHLQYCGTSAAEDGMAIVTEAHVTDPGVAGQLETSLAMLRALDPKENVHLPAITDLFPEIDHAMETCSYWFADQATEYCSYWFADHAHRTVFWLHPVDTDALTWEIPAFPYTADECERFINILQSS